jgi:hypothetical protein
MMCVRTYHSGPSRSTLAFSIREKPSPHGRNTMSKQKSWIQRKGRFILVGYSDTTVRCARKRPTSWRNAPIEPCIHFKTSQNHKFVSKFSTIELSLTAQLDSSPPAAGDCGEQCLIGAQYRSLLLLLFPRSITGSSSGTVFPCLGVGLGRVPIWGICSSKDSACCETKDDDDYTRCLA